MLSRAWIGNGVVEGHWKSLFAGVVCLLLATAAVGADQGKGSAQTVDSGSFGVFMGGRRVATETFSIHQDSNGSSITSEFKSEAGVDKAVQSSDLELTSAGDLRKYEWKEVSPGQSQAVVVPNDNFLIERSSKLPQEKPLEQPFLLPTSTSMLDDYFFVHREILAWRYLATSCKHDNGQLQCPLKEGTQMGTLNAHVRASMPVTVQYSGREKIPLHGAERELIRLDLKTESGDWTLWLDDQLKLQRILDSTTNTEVVRD